MHPALASRQNPICKLVRSLHTPRGRREQGLFLAEGRNAVEAALAANWPIRKLLCTEDHLRDWLKHDPELNVQTVTPAILEYLSEAQSNPGVLALCALPQQTIELSFNGCLLVLDGIGDPGNIGTLIRSADATGAGAVLCTASSADPFSPKAIRSSAGSVLRLPPLQMTDNSPQTVVQQLQAQNIPIITADVRAEISCFEYQWPEKCALILGHETRGVSLHFASAATTQLKIPIYGHAESLNVAMAGTVMLYAWRNAQQD